MKMTLSKKLGILILALVSGVVVYLRLLQLGTTPPGINIDEASSGYDAFSFLKTGKDSWGNGPSLSLKSFGDYKPAGFVYLLVPFVQVFGLNTTTTRLPSALAGLLTLLVLYKTLQLFRPHRWMIAGLSLFLALSPWAFGMSRTFFSTNVALFFLTAGWYLLVAAIVRKGISGLRLTTGVGLLALASYIYFADTFIALLLLAGWGIMMVKQRTLRGQQLWLPGVVVVLLFVPLILETFSPHGVTRLNQEGKLHAFGNSLVINENREFCYLASHQNARLTKLCYGLWNKPVLKVEAAYRTLVEQLGVSYLFLKSNNEYIVSPGYGTYLSYLWLPFLTGLVVVGRALLSPQKREERALATILAGSWLASQLPLILAEVPTIHRNPFGLYLIFICISLGVHTLWQSVSQNWSWVKYGIALVMLILVGWYHAQYLTFYFAVDNKKTEKPLYAADAPTIYPYILSVQEKYDLIVDNAYYGPLYLAFYGQIDPKQFQTQAVPGQPDEYGWIHTSRFGKIVKGGPTLGELLCRKQQQPTEVLRTLLITTPVDQFSQYALLRTKSFTGVHTLHEIYDIDATFDRIRMEGKIPCLLPPDKN